MKNIIPISLIVVIMVSVFSPKITLAYSDTSKTKMEDAVIDYDQYTEDSEEGASNIGDSSEKKGYTIEESSKNSIIKNVIKIFNIIPSMAGAFMTILTLDNNATEINRTYGKEFSIQKVVFNKVGILDINFFNRHSDETALQKNLRDQISKFYYVVRNIAVVFMLIVLIYTGIRMAISSVAVEKAKYKKMLINWLTGFAILMILPYIMIFILQLGQVLIDFCETIMTSICGDEVFELEETIIDKAINSTEKGFSIIIPTIMYWMIVFYQVKFLWIYGKRLFSTVFLVIISPLVLVQYIFDKVADDEGTAFKSWMTELTLNVLIQPLHAMLYMIFMSMALNILEEAPILAIVFLGALSRGERVLRNILRVKNSTTVQSMKDNVNAKELSRKLGGK